MLNIRLGRGGLVIEFGCGMWDMGYGGGAGNRNRVVMLCCERRGGGWEMKLADWKVRGE
jgi:hypothetical protein